MVSTYGFLCDHIKLAKIEKGKRAVGVDELMALAFALGVPPIRLLLPADSAEDVVIARTDPTTKAGPTRDTVTPAPNMARWMTGDLHMGGTRLDEVQTIDHRLIDDGGRGVTSHQRFYFDAVDNQSREAERTLPGLQAARAIAGQALDVLANAFREHHPAGGGDTRAPLVDLPTALRTTVTVLENLEMEVQHLLSRATRMLEEMDST